MDLTFQPTKFLVLLAVTGIGLLLFRIPLKNGYERQFLYFGILGNFCLVGDWRHFTDG